MVLRQVLGGAAIGSPTVVSCPDDLAITAVFVYNENRFFSMIPKVSVCFAQ